MSDILKFKKLSDREHVLKRPGRYIGSITETDFIMPDKSVIKVSPAFGLIFTEVIANSIDHSKTPEGKCLDKIDVSMSKLTQSIIVSDNGAGIPIVKHPEYGIYIPEMVLSHLRAGTNFDDDGNSQTTGQNGEGVSLTNIFSNEFSVDINDGSHMYHKTWLCNMSESNDHVIKPKKQKNTGTKITYKPDMKRFGCELFTDDHIKYIKEVVVEMAAVNPNIKFTFNNELIDIDFVGYAKRFCDDVVSFVNENYEICVGVNPNEFKDVSFINSTKVNNGGTHVDYFGNKIIQALRIPLEKKMKTNIKPNTIRQNLWLFLNIKMNNPRYDSQTKDLLITSPSDYGFSFDVSKQFSSDMVKSNLYKDLINVVKRSIAIADLDNAIKKVKPPKNIKAIPKYEPAIEKKDRSKCSLFLVEGDSAANPIISARNPTLHGVFPLRGKLINVRGLNTSTILKNAEIQGIIQILGINLKTKSIENLRYSKVVIATDADLDGHHICGLLLNMFITLLPNFVKDGMVYKLKTPIITGIHDKKPIEFFSQKEFEEFNGKVTSVKYHKGLGGHSTEAFERFLNDPKYIEPLEWDDKTDESLDLAFNKKRADDRKSWLGSTITKGE